MKKKLNIQEKAELAMKKAIKEVVERHKKEKRPLAIWKNGKVVHISAAKVYTAT